MADIAHNNTDKQIAKLEKAIKNIYQEAQDDLEVKINQFTSNYKVKEAIHLKELKEGKISKADYDNWVKGQVFQGKQWDAKRDQIIDAIHNSNTMATKIINGAMYGVFTNNANYTAYSLEHGAGVNFGFGIYDTATVSKLLKDNPDLLPKWKINEQKDYVWNKKKVNNAITQGIIQGEKLDQISKRLSQGLAAQNENTMKTFARTAMTGAQNAGREQRFQQAKTKGIDVVKEWMATLDGVTRHSHRMLDGEQIKVAKDPWHPTKFSNGCRYPGDPQGPAHEVYNCRCTMVGDILDYPEEYERYDNIDGKPVKNMTYKEWYKAKYGEEIKEKKFVEKGMSTLTNINYANYPGGKDTFDVIQKYNYDYDKWWNESTDEDYAIIIQHTSFNAYDAKPWFDAAKKEVEEANVVSKVSKAEDNISQLKNQVNVAKSQLKAFEDSPSNVALFKNYNELWGKDTTILDYEQKKSFITTKRNYLNNEIESEARRFADELMLDPTKYKSLMYKLHQYDNFDELIKDKSFVEKIYSIVDDDDYPPFTDMDDIKDLWDIYKSSSHTKKFNKNIELLSELNEFEDNAIYYKNLISEYTDKKLKLEEAEKALKSAEAAFRAANRKDMFEPEAYSQARKNNAIWAKSPKEADDALRHEAGKVWNNASQAEKDAVYDYTGSYHKFNEPLRGIEYGSSDFLGVGNTDLDARYMHNGSKLNALTDLLDKAELPQDEWFQRGCNWSGMGKFFQCDLDFLQNATQEQLENELLGKSVTEYAFMSAGSSKGRGFSDQPILMNIYAPRGTKAMYIEPISQYGTEDYISSGFGMNWDGVKVPPKFGTEVETLFQQGTVMRITKVEKRYNGFYVDMEIIDQSVQQRWKP